ncbi:hypothetical protein [Borrelia miyamotoi]|nr:hypothetical protein [Borrelia miyamotoi]
MYEIVCKIFSKKMLNVFSMHKLKILIFLFLSEDNILCFADNELDSLRI